VIAIISAAQSAGRRSTGIEEIRFIQKILEFFNFNISLAKRDSKSYRRLHLLLSVIPSFKELNEAFKQYELEESEVLVYKIVIDMMERYYSEFEGPKFRKY